jgi:NAD+ kinase
MSMDKPILVLIKKSFYEVYGLEKRDPRFMAMLTTDSEHARELIDAHEENARAIERVEEYLDARGLAHVRSEGHQGKVDGRFSLVVAVGGDGTLLAAAHQVLETRVVGINSRPGQSVGHFCAADCHDFEPLLDAILDGKRPCSQLTRMDIHINGFRRSPPALNDLLFAGTSPAETTRYRIGFRGEEETHRSSGIWVATPAGSTAGIGAAGGQAMTLADKELQFLVREPFKPRGINYAVERGLFTDGLVITNLTPEAAVFVDGTRHHFSIFYGDVIEPRVSSHPLRIYL